jgi:hypothetical protein
LEVVVPLGIEPELRFGNLNPPPEILLCLLICKIHITPLHTP